MIRCRCRRRFCCFSSWFFSLYCCFSFCFWFSSPLCCLSFWFRSLFCCLLAVFLFVVFVLPALSWSLSCGFVAFPSSFWFVTLAVFLCWLCLDWTHRCSFSVLWKVSFYWNSFSCTTKRFSVQVLVVPENINSKTCY